MRLSFFLVLVLFAAFLFVGCSGNSLSDNSAASNTGAHDEIRFNSAAEALAEGNRLFDNGETVEAIEALQQAVKLDPDLAEAYFKLGVAYSLIESEANSPTAETQSNANDSDVTKTNSQKAFENAVTAYKKIIEANKDDDNAFFNLGLSYNKLNKDQDAARALREAVRLKPDDTQYQTELGSIFIKLAKYHEAVSALKKATDLDPTNIKAVDLLEKAQAGSKRIDYISVKPDEKASTNANANVDDDSDVPAANTGKTPANQKVSKTPVPTMLPQKTPRP